MRITLAAVLDTVTLTAASFFLFLCALRFDLPASAALPLAAILAFFCGATFFILHGKAAKKRYLTRKEETLKNRVFRALSLMPLSRAETLLKTAVEGAFQEPTVKERTAVLLAPSARYLLFASQYAPKKEEILALRREIPSDLPVKAVTLASSLESEGEFRALGIEVPQPSVWFLALRDGGNLPPLPEESLGKCARLKKNALRIFHRKKAGRFFFFGVWTTLVSFVAPFPVYYLVTGSVFLLFAVLIVLFGKRKPDLG